MTVTTCLSSSAMSRLLAWRNPQGREENWFSGNRPQQNPHVVKCIIAEIGLLALTATAAFESFSYTALKVASLSIYSFTNRPYQVYSSLLESSSFTVLWSIADAFYYNFFISNVLTRESFARYWTQRVNLFFSNTWYRAEDMNEVAQWSSNLRDQQIQNELLGPIVKNGREITEIINQGSLFLVKEILPRLTLQDLQLFRESDISIYWFILTKAIFIYTLGSKKEKEVPKFFKSETEKAIQELRKKIKTNSTIPVEELSILLENFKNFEKSTETAPLLAMFNDLKSIAYKEQQSGLFIMYCWPRALDAALKINSCSIDGDKKAENYNNDE